MCQLLQKIVLVMMIAALAVPVSADGHGDHAGDDMLWVTYPGKGSKKSKHIVLISGDEEYRSEEAMPMLGKVLSQRHGFTCTVLFPIDPKTGEINPDAVSNLPGLEALKTADLMIIATRFRQLPDEDMQHIDDYVRAGKPIIGLRTATHAFGSFKQVMKGKFAHYDNSYAGEHEGWHGGFGRAVLGEKWIAHHGRHKREGARGIIAPGAERHPINNGIKDGEIWGPSDVYTVRLPLPGDSKPLVMGQVQKDVNFDPNDRWFGMRPTDPVLPETHKKNNPLMPVAWIKSYQAPEGKKGTAFTTTMGAATDLESEGLRRLIVNASYHLLDLKVPRKANVDTIGEFKPTAYGFRTFKKGTRPSDYALDKR